MLSILITMNVYSLTLRKNPYPIKTPSLQKQLLIHLSLSKTPSLLQWLPGTAPPSISARARQFRPLPFRYVHAQFKSHENCLHCIIQTLVNTDSSHRFPVFLQPNILGLESTVLMEPSVLVAGNLVKD